jgi:preprotein translocase subunit SecA
LKEQGVHVVTSNDYLAQRDCETMGGVYARLGLSCAVITASNQFLYSTSLSKLQTCSRQEAYQADITYGTASAFGFDYLRDHLVKNKQDLVQGERLGFVILDEADNILLDEARTPLIISGPARFEVTPFYQAMKLVRQLKPDLDYEIDSGKRTTSFTQAGIARLENWLGIKSEKGQSLYGGESSTLYYLDNCLKALTLYKPGEDYLVEVNTPHPNEFYHNKATYPFQSFKQKEVELSNSEWITHDHTLEEILPEMPNAAPRSELTFPVSEADFGFTTRIPPVKTGKVVLIDRITGRAMPGRRLAGGLHQALEAKEDLEIRPATATLATISLHAYFRQYSKLAGISGTLAHNKDTLHQLYGLETVIILTHRPNRRIDASSRVFLSKQAAILAVVQAAIRVRENGAAVLIGTPSLKISEEVSNYFARKGVPHQLLNARQTVHEAEVIARAGYPGRITIATNMAGRGTDIIPGGRYKDHLGDLARQLGLVKEVDKETPAWGKLEAAAEARLSRAKNIVQQAGGLHVFGLGLQSSARLDRQLAGRTGRQGEPGYSCLFLSLEDNLVGQFAGNNSAFRRLVEGNFATENSLVTDVPGELNSGLALSLIKECQHKAEGRQLDLLSEGIKFDAVLNQQREKIYADRHSFLLASPDELKEKVRKLTSDWLEGKFGEVSNYRATYPLDSVNLTDLSFRDWQATMKAWVAAIKPVFGNELVSRFNTSLQLERDVLGKAEIVEKLLKISLKFYSEVEKQLWEENIAQSLKEVALSVLDQGWADYLTVLDELRQGISLRAYGGRNPLQVYQLEAFNLWEGFKKDAQAELLKATYKILTLKTSKLFPGQI